MHVSFERSLMAMTYALYVFSERQPEYGIGDAQGVVRPLTIS
jgi:hypothetical protein